MAGAGTFTYVYQCHACSLEFEVTRRYAKGPRCHTCPECKAHRARIAGRERLAEQRRVLDAGRPLTVPEIHRHWPSTTWGTEQWYAVLRADDQLFFAILEGIAGATKRRRPGRLAGELASEPRTSVVVPRPRAPANLGG